MMMFFKVLLIVWVGVRLWWSVFSLRVMFSLLVRWVVQGCAKLGKKRVYVITC